MIWSRIMMLIKLLPLYPNDLQWLIDLYNAKTKSMQATESWIDLEEWIRLSDKYCADGSYQSIPASLLTCAKFESVEQKLTPFAITNAWIANDEHVDWTNGWYIPSSNISAVTMIVSLEIASPTIIAFRNIDNNLSELILNSSMILYSVYSLLSHRARTRIMSISISCQDG